MTFRRCGWLCCVLVAVGDAVYLFLGGLWGRSFVWGLTDYLEFHVPLQFLAGEGARRLLTVYSEPSEVVSTRSHVRVQHVDEQSVVLEEVVSLEAAAVADPKVGEKFAVVGCRER